MNDEDRDLLGHLLERLVQIGAEEERCLQVGDPNGMRRAFLRHRDAVRRIFDLVDRAFGTGRNT